MVIREADGQLEISASSAELEGIAERIAELTIGAACSVGAKSDADPKPYTRCLAALELRAADGPIRVVLSGDRVEVTGSIPMMRTFASFFRFEANAPRGTHHHHEWFEGNAHVAQDSAALVIRVD